MSDGATSQEALRQLNICHACRYCEGYCDMFGALSKLPLLAETDVAHLANVCHDCRACYQACMYTDPHEFAVNIPRAMADVRLEVYSDYAVPHRLGRLFKRGAALAVILTTLVCSVALTVLVIVFDGPGGLWREYSGAGSFYEVVPAHVMIGAGLAAGSVSVLLIALGQGKYWRRVYPPGLIWRSAKAWPAALKRAAVLASLRGGGDGCYYPAAEASSQGRRWMHHLTAYGFLTTFAATCAAAVQEHLFHELPPFGFLSAPVLLGTTGGLMMLVGTAGLLYLKGQSDRRLGNERGRKLEYAFLVTLLLLAVTGLLLLALRGTRVMPSLLILHLALVGAFFITIPYGKMVHAAFRLSALARDHLSKLVYSAKSDQGAALEQDFSGPPAEAAAGRPGPAA